MFKPHAMWTRALRVLLSVSMIVSAAPALRVSTLQAQELRISEPTSSQGIMHRVSGSNQRIEMIVNSSRLLTLDQPIPRAQVNNKDVLELTPLSPNEIQVFAKKAGVTQINLWNDRKQLHTIDVVVNGDAQELQKILRDSYPHSTLKIVPTANSVLLTGYVDRADHVAGIIKIAEDYYPKVIPNITVGGVQQIQLRVKVCEVSRTRLRALGTDFATTNGNDFFVSSVSGLIDATAAAAGTAAGTGADTMRFGFVDGNKTFFAFFEFLQKNELMKILAEPTVTTVSGRPAYVQAGGEFPILVPQSLGTVSIEYKQYGTRVDMVPVVLGNGNIRLDVRPSVSEIDVTRSVTINGAVVPGLKNRIVDTAVEMKPGQTLALAGLVQVRVDANKQGVPYLMDTPYVGAFFSRKRTTEQEVELLVLVTPELAEAMEPCEVPPCGPGQNTTHPNSHEFYAKGIIEKPSCGPCGTGWCNGPAGDYVGAPQTNYRGMQGEVPGDVYGGRVAPGTRIEEVPPSPSTRPTPNAQGTPKPSLDSGARLTPRTEMKPTPTQSTSRRTQVQPASASTPREVVRPAREPRSTLNMRTTPGSHDGGQSAGRTSAPATQYNPSRTQNERSTYTTTTQPQGPRFIGPVGYDVIK